MKKLCAVFALLLAACGPAASANDGSAADAAIDAAPAADAAVSADGAADARPNDADGCGPNGEEHSGHCHCDSGYYEAEGLYCLPIPACAGTNDGNEPNDTPATGTMITESRTLGGLRVCPGDVDFFRVMLRAGQTLTVQVTFRNSDGDLDAYLWPADVADWDETEPTAGSDGTVDNERFAYTATTAGTYAVGVLGYNAAQAPYSVQFTLSP